MRKHLLLAVVLLVAAPAFAASECRYCDPGTDGTNNVALFCNLAPPDRLGSFRCEVVSVWTPNGISGRCWEREPYCMTIEVYG